VLLPVHPRRAWLQSFWIVMCLAGGFLLGGILAGRLGLAWFWLGAAAGCGLIPIGVIRPAVAKAPYRLWFRIADLYSRVVRLAVKAVMFFVIFVIVGGRRSSLRLDRPTEMPSMWLPRTTLSSENYPHEHESGGGSSAPRSWTAVYGSWARSSGNGWAIALLPFLLLLSVLEPEQERTVPAGIYTLF
jgi:hypothetical protein